MLFGVYGNIAKIIQNHLFDGLNFLPDCAKMELLKFKVSPYREVGGEKEMRCKAVAVPVAVWWTKVQYAIG